MVPLPGCTAAAGFVIESWVEREAPVSWPDGRWTCVIDAERAGREARLAVGNGGAPQLSVPRTGESIWRLGYRVDGRGPRPGGDASFPLDSRRSGRVMKGRHP